MSNFNRHVSSDKRKWVAVFIAILLIVAFLVTGVLTDWFTNWRKYIKCDHYYDENGVCVKCGAEKLDDVESDKPEKDKGDDVEANSVAGGGMATVLPGNGIRLMAAKMAPMAGVPTSVVENTWTLTASVNEHADDKYINWSVRWKDAQAAWAKGKTVTEYVTVTPTQAGALTATVKVIKDFGAQIEVVATSRDNPEKSATCVFDYVQKITGITFNMPNISSESTSFTYEFQTTAYTVAADLILEAGGDKTIKIDEGMILLSQMKHTLEENYTHSQCDYLTFTPVPFSISNNKIVLTQPALLSSSVGTYIRASGLAGFFIQCLSSEATESALTAAFRYEMEDNDNEIMFTISYKSVYGGKTYSSGEKVIYGDLDGSVMHVSVDDVTLSQSHIYA